MIILFSLPLPGGSVIGNDDSTLESTAGKIVEIVARIHRSVHVLQHLVCCLCMRAHPLKSRVKIK
jgi:hypothetical protein